MGDSTVFDGKVQHDDSVVKAQLAVRGEVCVGRTDSCGLKPCLSTETDVVPQLCGEVVRAGRHSPPWEATADAGAECDRWRRLLREWMPKFSGDASEKPTYPLPQDSLENQGRGRRVGEVMRGVAEQVVGREPTSRDMPCLRVCRKEVLESKKKKWLGATRGSKMRDGQESLPTSVREIQEGEESGARL